MQIKVAPSRSRCSVNGVAVDELHALISPDAFVICEDSGTHRIPYVYYTRHMGIGPELPEPAFKLGSDARLDTIAGRAIDTVDIDRYGLSVRMHDGTTTFVPIHRVQMTYKPVV